jgi:hypothetical protein
MDSNFFTKLIELIDRRNSYDKARSIDRHARNAQAKTAERISNVANNHNNLNQIKSDVANRLKYYKTSNELFEIFNINKIYIDEIVKMLFPSKFIILADKDSNTILVSWLGSTSWEKFHGSKAEKLIETNIQAFIEYINSNPNIINLSNWMNPKLTKCKESNKKALLDLINQMK